MTTEQFEALYSPQVLCTQLDGLVKSQIPTGINPDVGMVMDVVETTDTIQMWVLGHMGNMRTFGRLPRLSPSPRWSSAP